MHPYHMEPYQLWFHAHAPLAMGHEAPDRYVEKGRGVGATIMVAMDLLLLAHRFPRVHIPVAGRQAETGDEFIQKAHDLMRDTVVEGFFDPDPDLLSSVRLGNGSTLESIPGGNPASIRSRRAPAAAYDEFAFHTKPEELWRAGRGVLSEGGQLTVLSTHNGSGTLFHRLIEDVKARRITGVRFFLPAHDPIAYRADIQIPDQIASGSIRLIAPWLSASNLEKLRLEDPVGYEQENLARVMDETLNLLTTAQADAAFDETLTDWGRPVSLDEDAVLAQLVPPVSIPRRPSGSPAPVYVGVDFASQGDLAAYVAHQVVPGGVLEQRYAAVFRWTDTPTQNRILRLLEAELRPAGVLIDMTGPGTGLYEHARVDLSCPVWGIHFGSRVDVGGHDQGGRDVTVPVKKAMALHFAHLVQQSRARLLGSPHPLTFLQKRHITAVRRSDLDAPRTRLLGHADLFWANALAAWGTRVTAPPGRVVQKARARAPRGQPGDLSGIDRRR